MVHYPVGKCHHPPETLLSGMGAPGLQRYLGSADKSGIVLLGLWIIMCSMKTLPTTYNRRHRLASRQLRIRESWFPLETGVFARARRCGGPKNLIRWTMQPSSILQWSNSDVPGPIAGAAGDDVPSEHRCASAAGSVGPYAAVHVHCVLRNSAWGSPLL